MKLVYCSANIYLLVYISHFLPIISRRHLKHTADKCTCAWEFKKPFIFCFITLRYIQAKINEQLNLFLASLSVRWKIIDRDANASEVFPYFAPLKGLRILESDEVLLVESGFPEFFSCGFRNPGLWNPEYSSRDPESTNDWNPESKLYRPIIRNQEPITRSEQLPY